MALRRADWLASTGMRYCIRAHMIPSIFASPRSLISLLEEDADHHAVRN